MSEAESAEKNADAKPKKKKSPILLILVGGVVLGGGGLAAYLFLGHRGTATAEEKPAATEEKGGDKSAAAKKSKPQIVTLKPIVVNLRNSKGTRYLKVTIGMEAANEAVSNELIRLSPQLSDFLIDKLCSVDISDVDNSAGRNKLKREILAGTNEILESGYVNNVYFTEFVIQ